MRSLSRCFPALRIRSLAHDSATKATTAAVVASHYCRVTTGMKMGALTRVVRCMSRLLDENDRTIRIEEAMTWKTRLEAIEAQKVAMQGEADDNASKKKASKNTKKYKSRKNNESSNSKGVEYGESLSSSSSSSSPSSSPSNKEWIDRFPPSADRTVKASNFGKQLDRLREGDFDKIQECYKIAKTMADQEPLRYKKIYGYNILLQALLKRAKFDSPRRTKSKACNHVLNILSQIEKTYYLFPNTTTYNLALKAVILRPSKGEDVDGAAALEILASMKKSKFGKPDNISYSTIIDALGRCSERREAATGRMCLALLQEMQDNEELPSPDRITYNSVLKALASVETEDMTKTCLEIIEEMKTCENEKNRPDDQTYSALLRGLANKAEAGNQAALEQMSEVLASMGDMTNVIHCNIYLNTLVNSASTQISQDGATDRCMSFLGEMIISDTHKPDRITYNTAMNFLVKMVVEGEDEAAQKCLVLINEMRNSSESPDVVTYSTAMKAFAKLAERGHGGAVDTNLKLLKEMQECQILPDSYTYSIVLQTLVNAMRQSQGNAYADVDTCMEILNEMNNSDRPAVMPNTIHYTKVLNAFVQRANNSDDSDTIALMIDKCLLLLDEMKQSPRTFPDVVTYSSVISALAKQIEKAELKIDQGLSLIEQCFFLLEEMQQQPNIIANTLTYMTIAQTMLKRIEKGNDMVFDKYLLLMAKGSSSSKQSEFGCFVNHKMQPANNPFLVPILDVMLKLSNQGESSVVDKCVAIIENCENFDPLLTPSDVKRANFTLHIILKALVYHAPTGSTSELNRSDRPFLAMKLFQEMRDSEYFKPSLHSSKVVARGLVKRARKLQDRMAAWEALHTLDQARLDHGLDDTCVHLGIEAMTAVLPKDSEEDVLSVISKCMEFIERSKQQGLQIEAACFGTMLNYCVHATKICDLHNIVKLYDIIMKGVESTDVPNFKLDRITTKFLNAIESRTTNGDKNVHQMGDEVLKIGSNYNSHQINVTHLNNVLRTKASISFETAFEFLRQQQKDGSNLGNLINKESIDILLKVICIEKHRMDHAETISRIDEMISIMKASNTSLSQASEELLQEYHLLKEVKDKLTKESSPKHWWEDYL